MQERSTEPVRIPKVVLIILSRSEISFKEEEVIEGPKIEISKRLSFESFQR
jgi:hypothetical protein